MIKIHLLDKKNNLKGKYDEEYICLPKSLREIREEAIKTYNWLRFVEKKNKTNYQKNAEKYSLDIKIIDENF